MRQICALPRALAIGWLTLALIAPVSPRLAPHADAAAAVAGLPSVADLADKAGRAVVNISTMKKGSASDSAREMFRGPRGPRSPEMPNPHGSPFDDFFDQFEKFFGERGRPRSPQRSLGSGFILSADGLIVTNNHVIENADEIKVNLMLDGKQDKNAKPYDAEVIGRDPETDLALLKIKADKPLPTLAFADSDKARIGDWVMAIGNPFGLDHSVTVGIVSAKGRTIGAGPFDSFIQTDASINPGNSGGPLIDMDGRVVGINTAIIATGQGIGFAIPSNLASGVIEQLKDGKKVQRGWLGVTIQDVDENTAKALGLKEAKGALISQVMPNEPGAKAGMLAGDVVVKVDDTQVDDSAAFLRAIAAKRPGAKVRLEVIRKGETKSLTAELGERDPKKIAEQGRSGGPAKPEAPEEFKLGLAMRPLEKRESEFLAIPPGTGLIVTDVTEGSAAQQAGLRAGDAILEANGKPVNSSADFRTVLEGDAKAKGVVMLLIKRQGQTIFRTIPLDQAGKDKPAQ